MGILRPRHQSVAYFSRQAPKDIVTQTEENVNTFFRKLEKLDGGMEELVTSLSIHPTKCAKKSKPA